MKKIIFLVLLLTFIVPGIVSGADHSDKPASKNPLIRNLSNPFSQYGIRYFKET